MKGKYKEKIIVSILMNSKKMDYSSREKLLENFFPLFPEMDEKLKLIFLETLLYHKRFLIEKREKEKSPKNPYHNIEHAKKVVFFVKLLLQNLKNPHLFTSEEKILLVESGWRHDDGHSGFPVRQENYKESNEEYACFLLEEDFAKWKNFFKNQIEFMKKNILATSFGQSDQSKLGIHFRSYKPESDAEFILAFADVSGFYFGFDKWIIESINVSKELKENMDLDEWIESRKKFILYIKSLFNRIKCLLKVEFCLKLEEKLLEVSKKLDELGDKKNKQRENYRKIIKN